MKFLLPILCLATSMVHANETDSAWSAAAAAAVSATETNLAQSTDPKHPGSSAYPYASFTTTDRFPVTVTNGSDYPLERETVVARMGTLTSTGNAPAM